MDVIEIIREEWRTARNIHKCDYCGGTIRPLERYRLCVNKFDGKLYEWKAHEKCEYIAQEIWDYADPDEGMDSDDFCEACSDVCRTFVCPDCGKWDTDECDESYCLDKLYDLFQTKELYREKRDLYGYTYWKLRDRSPKLHN